MAFKAIHKHARISARKVRLVADLIRGKFADEALDILRYSAGSAERGCWRRCSRSAIGNAQDPDQNPGKSIKAEQLVISDVRVDGGPMFKRVRPMVSRPGLYGPPPDIAHFRSTRRTLASCKAQSNLSE